MLQNSETRASYIVCSAWKLSDNRSHKAQYVRLQEDEDAQQDKEKEGVAHNSLENLGLFAFHLHGGCGNGQRLRAGRDD